jgi:transcriptional regulator with XRE-family HTH domain
VAFARRALAARRQAAHLTQETLAQRAGVTVGTVAKLEQGRDVNPRLKTCEKLARALACPVCELIGGGSTVPRRSKKQ